MEHEVRGTAVKTGLLPATVVLSALLAVSVVSAVMLTTVQYTITMLEPLSLGSWQPIPPGNISTFPGVNATLSNTLINNAGATYKVRYTLNVTAQPGVKGGASLLINNTALLVMNYNGNSTQKTGDINIAPLGSHNINIRISPSADSEAGKNMTVNLRIERLAP